jgi:hypothetical protein
MESAHNSSSKEYSTLQQFVHSLQQLQFPSCCCQRWPGCSNLLPTAPSFASHSTIESVDIVDGDDLILPWWSGKETSTLELLKSALAANTSITDIRVKMSDTSFDDHIIAIVQSSRQLESLSFRFRSISEEMAVSLMKQLSIERLIFDDCHISKEVAAVFVEALKGKHSFTEIDLFRESWKYKSWRYTRHWREEDDYTRRWKESIAAEIKKLTWSNRFQVDKDTFLHEVLVPASVSEKLCYRAMERANRYDARHKLTSDAPSMLYSHIREIPQFFTQFIVDDGGKQRMKKRRRV